MITVVGLGFIGLTTALGFSDKGYKVYGVDVDPHRLNTVGNGCIPFHEPHLKEALERNLNRTFFLSDSLEHCLKESAIVFYCVGTPCCGDGAVDLSYLKEAVEKTLSHLSPGDYKVLAIRSTVPPSSSREQIAPLIEASGFKIGVDVSLVANPEFLREGCAWTDFTSPDRIVIGESDPRGGDLVEDLYRSFGAPIFRVSLNTAEFIKYLSNTLLSTLVSFSNEQSMAAHKIGDIDISGAFRILHQDRRWYGSPAGMTSYVFPGCGFGGYCLPKDAQAWCTLAKTKGFRLQMLESVLDTNEKIKRFVVETVASHVTCDCNIGILGLSFKPMSDDVRDTPVKDIVSGLLQIGFSRLTAFDPMANENFKRAYGLPIDYADSLEDLIERVSLVLILTAWPEFLEQRDLIHQRRVLDFRYLLDRV
jgi:UDPglucose 6-dehydrogenase